MRSIGELVSPAAGASKSERASARLSQHICGRALITSVEVSSAIQSVIMRSGAQGDSNHLILSELNTEQSDFSSTPCAFYYTTHYLMEHMKEKNRHTYTKTQKHTHTHTQICTCRNTYRHLSGHTHTHTWPLLLAVSLWLLGVLNHTLPSFSFIFCHRIYTTHIHTQRMLQKRGESCTGVISRAPPSGSCTGSR